MKTQPETWTRRVIAIALPLLLLPIAFIPRATAETWNAVDAELSYSRQTGYFFFWDPVRLSILAQSSAASRDWWRLSDGDVTIDLQAETAPGTTTAACVADALDQLAANPATISLTALPIDGGGPVVPGDATADFVLTTVGRGGQEKFAGAMMCAAIVPEQSLLRELVLMPAHVYNERDKPYVEADGVDLFTFFALRQLVEASAVTAIESNAGDVAGTLAISLPCDTAEFNVLARGRSADSELGIRPSSFTAVAADGHSLPVTTVIWSLPDAHRVSSLVLHANEIGLGRGVVGAREHESFDVSYVPPAGGAVFLAAGQWDCGEAGAAPVLIDID